MVSTSLNVERSQIQSNRVDGTFERLDKIEMLIKVGDKIKKALIFFFFRFTKKFFRQLGVE